MPPELLPDRACFGELLRPWKLGTFAVAMAILLTGALIYRVSDWDVGITIVMGSLTCLCAPWSVRVLLVCARGKPRPSAWWMVVSLRVAWLVVDGVYVAYRRCVGNRMLRGWNLGLSSALYFMAGFFWLYRGSLRELADEVRRPRVVTRRSCFESGGSPSSPPRNGVRSAC